MGQKLNLEQQAKEILRMAEESGVQSHFFSLQHLRDIKCNLVF